MVGFILGRVMRSVLGDSLIMSLMKWNGEKVYKNAMIQKQKNK